MPRRDRSRLVAADKAERVRRVVVTGLSEKLREQPQAFARLVELGLVDGALLEREPDRIDLGDVIRRFRDRITEIAATEPSVLERLDVRPLDVIGRSEHAPQLESGASRVPLTVVFSDLEGFTSFTSEKGDAEAGALLRDHYDAVDDIVRSRGGQVVKKLGDGHMLSFAESSAAVMAAIELVGASPGVLRLRAGAHAGPVMRSDGDLFGHVVNVASRVTDLADGGIALVTAEVREGVGRLPRVEFRHARAERLNGLDEPVEVCEVVSV